MHIHTYTYTYIYIHTYANIHTCSIDSTGFESLIIRILLSGVCITAPHGEDPDTYERHVGIHYRKDPTIWSM